MGIAVGAAIAFAIVTAGVVAFQIALALGAPWGSYAMGGAFPGRFPGRMRIAAVVLNSITPSAGERRTWVPVTLVMLASSLVVAITAA